MIFDKEKYDKEMVELKKKFPEVTFLVEATENEVDWLKQNRKKKGKE